MTAARARKLAPKLQSTVVVDTAGIGAPRALSEFQQMDARPFWSEHELVEAHDYVWVINKGRRFYDVRARELKSEQAVQAALAADGRVHSWA